MTNDVASKSALASMLERLPRLRWLAIFVCGHLAVELFFWIDRQLILPPQGWSDRRADVLWFIAISVAWSGVSFAQRRVEVTMAYIAVAMLALPLAYYNACGELPPFLYDWGLLPRPLEWH